MTIETGCAAKVLPVYSYKHLATPYQSDLEKDFLIYQSFKDDVADIERNPYTTGLLPTSKKYLGSANYFVHIRDRRHKSVIPMDIPMIIKICPKKLWQKEWSDKRADYKAVRKFCAKNGFHFAMYDESRIRHQAWANVKYIMGHVDPYGHPEDIEAILMQVEMMGVTTIEYILCRFFGSELLAPQGERTILHLMATKRLGFDVWGELNEKTEIWHVQRICS